MTNPGIISGGSGFKSLPALPWDHYQVAQGDATLPNPGFGDFVFTCPSDVMLEILHVEFLLTTTAAAGNRFPHLVISAPDGRNAYVASWLGLQGPTTAFLYYYDADAPAQYSVNTSPTNYELHIPIPKKLIVTPGMKIQSFNNGFVSGADVYSNIYMYFRQYSSQERLSWT